MIEIRLLTQAGDYVTAVSVPPFRIAPDVIRWGSRIFVLTDHDEYREGLEWVSLDVPHD